MPHPLESGGLPGVCFETGAEAAPGPLLLFPWFQLVTASLDHGGAQLTVTFAAGTLRLTGSGLRAVFDSLQKQEASAVRPGARPAGQREALEITSILYTETPAAGAGGGERDF